MPNFWKVVNDVIREADILLEILDSRMVEESRNKEIERKVKAAKKKLIFVINKCDLAEKTELERWKRKLRPSVFMSAKEHLGTTMLREIILKSTRKKIVKVGVLGYPNTGKSSVINALKGRAAASTSPVSGHTKGMQMVKVSQRLYLIDTPGVFPYKEQDEEKHAIITAKTFTNLKDPEESVLRMIEQMPKPIERYYKVKHDEDPEIVLENIALALKKLKKGGLPDTNAASRIVLRDWQEGKITKIRE